jgi:hypothetical protein
MNPGFSERTFEFCFNAEFCQAFGGLLASHPHIPSQQEEKDLGYDVEFKIQQSQFTTSIFLQHKVVSYAEKKAGRNAKFYDHHSGPYFRFPIDNEQHNTLCELSRTKGNAYYCAPKFHLRHELEGHFRGTSIGDNCILLDPLDVGDVVDNDRHNITFGPAGANPCLHSEIRKFHNVFSGGKESPPERRPQKIDNQYIERLSDELLSRTSNSKYSDAITSEVRKRRPINIVQHVLAHVYDVSWILLP